MDPDDVVAAAGVDQQRVAGADIVEPHIFDAARPPHDEVIFDVQVVQSPVASAVSCSVTTKLPSDLAEWQLPRCIGRRNVDMLPFVFGES